MRREFADALRDLDAQSRSLVGDAVRALPFLLVGAPGRAPVSITELRLFASGAVPEANAATCARVFRARLRNDLLLVFRVARLDEDEELTLVALCDRSFARIPRRLIRQNAIANPAPNCPGPGVSANRGGASFLPSWFDAG